MAEEVFRRDGYLSEFEADVVSVKDDQVVLTNTAFYPGGGGQVCDTGTIQGQRVTEVRYEGKEIVHKVPNNNFKAGDHVWCSIDWDRRLDLMMGHTGEHLLFCSLRKQDPDLAITKIYISPEDKYVIVNHDVPWDKIKAALQFANQAIRDNLSVTKAVMSRDDQDLAKVRIKLDRIPEDEEITVVAIGDIDYSACSGIHVMETSELEQLFVDRKISAGKDGVAIHFKVGPAAADAAMALANTCLQVIDETGSKPEDLIKTVANLQHELKVANDAKKTVTRQRIEELRPTAIDGTAVYSGLFADADRKTLTDAAEEYRSQGGVAVFVSTGETLAVMLVSGTPRVNCRTVLGDVLKQFDGRGGGKPDFAQGGVPDATKGQAVLNALLEAVKKVL